MATAEEVTGILVRQPVASCGLRPPGQRVVRGTHQASHWTLVLFIEWGVLGCDVLVEIQVQCPHCGEIIFTTADTSQGDYSTIEDCEVCCAPMNIEVACEPGRVEAVHVTLA
jgi:hypothetical protein